MSVCEECCGCWDGPTECMACIVGCPHTWADDWREEDDDA